MIRRGIQALAIICGLILTGCSSTGGFVPVTVTSVQQAAVNACGFLPLASSVTALLPTPAALAAGTAEAIAALICSAVAPVSPATGVRMKAAGAPSINGVVIHGEFVQ
jgi:hypothetical protein